MQLPWCLKAGELNLRCTVTIDPDQLYWLLILTQIGGEHIVSMLVRKLETGRHGRVDPRLDVAFILRTVEGLNVLNCCLDGDLPTLKEIDHQVLLLTGRYLCWPDGVAPVLGPHNIPLHEPSVIPGFLSYPPPFSRITWSYIILE